MIKLIAITSFIILFAASCKKDTAIPAPVIKNNSPTQTDSLSPYLGTYTGICYWSVAAGSSGSYTVSLSTIKNSDGSMIDVYEGTSFYPFNASDIIRHQAANTSGPSSSLTFSNDSLLMFVMQSQTFHNYYCKKQ